MGLTYQSTKVDSLVDLFEINKSDDELVIALAGNPNTGKSTVFNALTGLHQHTGNWPGKTVSNAQGKFSYNGKKFVLVDLPGTYSLFATSEEEIVARDFICFGSPDAVVVVLDATCLERNLNLALQIMELTDNVVLCINLMDEAEKKGIKIDVEGLRKELGVRIVTTAARDNIGLDDLKREIELLTKSSNQATKRILYNSAIEDKIAEIENKLGDIRVNKRWMALRILDSNIEFIKSLRAYIPSEEYTKIESLWNIVEEDKRKVRESINNSNYDYVEDLIEKYVKISGQVNQKDVQIDNIIISRKYGIPIMLTALAVVFWVTIRGANYPSQQLFNLLFYFEGKLKGLSTLWNAPWWVTGLLIDGMYRTTAWVVSVMLPPMAIFFPLFTLLEDLGFLPRVAFNLDHLFKKACAHGKQCLTMCMGFGCNAAGVIGCRIIESPREKLIAITTNNFVPCNGRFPTLITIATVFFATGAYTLGGFIPILFLLGLIVLGVVVTLLVSYGLSKTILKGVPSTFTLELPPYRIPKVGRVLYTSLIDRTIFVLRRAVVVAIPAGMVIWLLANTNIGEIRTLDLLAHWLHPLASLIGLDGFILLAFVLGLPANEIVLPILLMCYMSTGTLIELDNLGALREILIANGWTSLTALNTMLFSLLHWPCSSTLITIKRETGSLKWTCLSFIIPTVVAFTVCLLTTSLYRMFV